MALTSSMEDYLESVLILHKEKGYARCVDISNHLNVTMPSVSRAVKELSKQKARSGHCTVPGFCSFLALETDYGSLQGNLPMKHPKEVAIMKRK